MSNVKPYVHLRIYKGEKILKDENGNINNENQLVKIQVETLEFNNYLKTLPASGFSKVEIEKVVTPDGKEAELKKEIREQIENVFKPIKAQETPQEKRIRELEEKLANLMSANPNAQILPSKPIEDDFEYKKDSVDLGTNAEQLPSSLEELRQEFLSLTGQKPHHTWKEEKLIQEIKIIKEASIK